MASTKNSTLGPALIALGVMAAGVYAASKLGVFDQTATESSTGDEAYYFSDGGYVSEGGGVATTTSAPSTDTNTLISQLAGLFSSASATPTTTSSDAINSGYNYANPSDEAADTQTSTSSNFVGSEAANWKATRADSAGDSYTYTNSATGQQVAFAGTTANELAVYNAKKGNVEAAANYLAISKTAGAGTAGSDAYESTKNDVITGLMSDKYKTVTKSASTSDYLEARKQAAAAKSSNLNTSTTS